MGAKREINQLDYETGAIIKTFDSVREVAENFNTDGATIWKAIKSRNGIMPSKKLRFAYKDEIVHSKKCKVRQLDYYTGELVDEYDSIDEAAKDNFVSLEAVNAALNKRNGYMKNVKLRFEFMN